MSKTENQKRVERSYSKGQKDASNGEHSRPHDMLSKLFGLSKNEKEVQKAYSSGWQNGHKNKK